MFISTFCLQKIFNAEILDNTIFVAHNYMFKVLECLTICHRSTNILLLEIREKSGIFWLTYQPHSSSANCTRELLKPLKDSASILDCNEVNFLVGSCGFFVSDVISEVLF